ncbi:FxLD family lantipeptide [Thermobifida alba]|jgi:FxLD family lantipeptide|uniref:FxLD family lantipeptide n=1 Tax=Thermobifida alba TaxID=53522 RepID=A0ABY4L3C3_THEAE|nr:MULTISPECIES: FxLD family lanthipeptide [Thermobifida]UPT22185.1 FxLD family lantipeptide [Thermobifida alba]
MTVQTPQTAIDGENTQFDLDISIVESGPVINDLMRLTDDGCGTTCESACPAQSGC